MLVWVNLHLYAAYYASCDVSVVGINSGYKELVGESVKHFHMANIYTKDLWLKIFAD